MPNVSILMTLREDFSERIERMRSAGGRFSKELDEIEAKARGYEQRMEALSARQAEYTVELGKAEKALNEAQAAFNRKPTDEREEALRKATAEYTELSNSLNTVTGAIKNTRKEYNGLTSDLKKIENGTYGKSKPNIFTRLAGAGLGSMLGGSLSNLAGTFVGSAFGEDVGNSISSVVGGLASGAAMGSVAGLPGMIVGGIVGGLSGLADSANETFSKRDDAFQSYVQEQYDTVTGSVDDTLESGSTVAGSREQTRLAFEQRFGSAREADEYLARVQDFAQSTNYGFDEIVGYSKLLLNSYDPEEVFDVLMSLSDASAGLNLDSSDVTTLISGLSRMRTTGKTTQEYLNFFSERGVDAYEALSRSTGADKSAIAEMVSGGEIAGADAAAAILEYINDEYGGLSDRLAGTYDAMVNNLEDARTMLDAAMGQGYNETRKAGIEAEQDFLSGLEGQAMEDAYGMIGQWKASLENLKEEYNRDALTAVMGGGVSELYQKDGELTEAGERLAQMADEYAELRRQYEEGSEDAGAKMGALLAEAQAMAINEYNASEGYQLELESQLGLAERLREDASLQDAYWDAGYTMGQQFTKGLGAGYADGFTVEDVSTLGTGANAGIYNEMGYQIGTPMEYPGHADGLARVPYDGYTAILHQDERVLTAAEARSYDRPAPAVNVTVTGNNFSVRDDADVDDIAQTIARRVVEAWGLM